MKAPKFADAQETLILKQGADGMPVADICSGWISQVTYFNWNEAGRSSKPAGCLRLTLPPVTTSLVAPDRPISNSGSGRYIKPLCAMTIGVFTCCCAVQDLLSIRRRSDISIAN